MPNANNLWGKAIKGASVVATAAVLGYMGYITKASHSTEPTPPAQSAQSAPAASNKPVAETVLSTPNSATTANTSSSPTAAPVPLPVAAPTPAPSEPPGAQESPPKPTGETVVSGYVVNRNTGIGVRGAEVTALTEPSQSVISDDAGYFRLVVSSSYRGKQLDVLIRKTGFNKKAITIEILNTGKTPNNKYSLEQLEGEPGGKVSTENLILDGTAQSPVATKMVVKENSQVTISATGTVRMGQVVGSSGPAGSTNPFMSGIAGMQYKIVKRDRMGTLLWRFVGDGDNDWSGYGADAATFTAPRSGHIEFLLNDNKRDDNSGSYKITVKARKT